jgi:hypothetical protein
MLRPKAPEMPRIHMKTGETARHHEIGGMGHQRKKKYL